MSRIGDPEATEGAIGKRADSILTLPPRLMAR